MELVTIECDLTAEPLKSPKKSSLSINYRRFRQSVYKKPNGHETIKEHKLVSPRRKLQYKISSVLQIESVLKKSKVISKNNWIRKHISDLISSKAAKFMSDGEAYSVKADVDIIFEKRFNLENEIESLVVKKEEEKQCAICLGELHDGVGCTEIQCSHVYHKDCIWKWLRKSMSCPTCRSCVCGQKSCNCNQSD